MALGIRDLHLTDPEYLVRIFDIRQGPSGSKPAFESLKRDLDKFPDAVIRVIVAGGDGTVLWALAEIEKHGIPSARVAVGHLPFGTGNDFSRATGFGGTTGPLTGANLRGLKNKVMLYSKENFVPFDLWNVEITCGADGGVFQIKQGRKTAVNDDAGKFHKVMGNYFSIGVESRIGVGFDRNRTTSQSCNKCVYICEGAKKNFARTVRVDEILDSLWVEEPAAPESPADATTTAPLVSDETAAVAVVAEEATTKATAVQGTAAVTGGRREIFKKIIKTAAGHAASMVFLNIPSISGGCDLWRGCDAVTKDPDALGKKGQSISDNKLEVVTVPSLFSLARAQLPVFNSHVGSRIAQTGGPFELVFKPELSRDLRTYMQVDGEFFQVNKPTTVRISWRRQAQVIVKQ
jgi:diacylglycerol kinase (ATP)